MCLICFLLDDLNIFTHHKYEEIIFDIIYMMIFWLFKLHYCKLTKISNNCILFGKIDLYKS
jgi:hypothetical protein